ncbi:cytochrome P450 [Hysterangium stoloniferum]|nr:cytochrome P450 [Hysterangium stoloniferum]
MALVSQVLVIFFAFIVWKVLKKLTAEKNPIANIAGPEKEHWLKGNYHRIFQDGLEYNLNLAEKYGGAVKIYGLLGDPQLIVSDPKALHHIVVKEQNIYEETDMFIMGNKLIFGEGLIATLGEQHRKQRKILNPVFSMANMRDLLPVIQPISNRLCAIFESQLPPDGGSKEVDVMPWMSRGALEYIGQAGLGHSFNALDIDARDVYTQAVKNLGPTTLRLILFRPFIPAVVRNFSLYWRNKIIDWAPIPALRDLQKIVEIMDKASKDILTEKRADLVRGKKTGLFRAGTKGKDIMSVMLEANAASHESEKLTEAEMLGQMNTFIFAGFENTATALSRVFHTLAVHKDAQVRLRTELRKAKREYANIAEADTERWKQVELPYDVLMGLPYLDAVVRETLRVYPPSSLFGRTLRKDTTLPLQYPIRTVTGKETTLLPLRANTNIIISIIASNHNKKVWGEDASEWRPERWVTSNQEFDVNNLSDSKDNVKYPGVYSTIMTFLGGNRACIGFKFAEMEIKQVIATLISHFDFSLPSALDGHGVKKEIYWKISALQVPVVRHPFGDGKTPSMPLDIRVICDDDFV